MKKKLFCFLLVLIVVAVSCSTLCVVFAETVRDGVNNTMSISHKEEVRKEYEHYISDLGNLPVTFVYGDKYYKGFSSDFFGTISSESVNERNGVLTTAKLYLYEDEKLCVTVKSVYYEDYNAYDYTVHFENVGTENSKVLKYVNAMDINFKGSNPVLKGILGDHVNSYAPYATDLTQKDVNFTSTAGRATHVYFPYFNLETDDGGAMLAIGWGGTWQADFHYDAKSNSTNFVGAGTVGFNSYLKAGESVRTPLMAVVRYFERDEDIATNAWRAWMVDCNIPRESADSDKSIQPFNLAVYALDSGRPNSDGSISEGYDSWQRSMDAFYDHGLTSDFRWIDAGWYETPYGGSENSDWWGTVGTWQIDKVKWPGDSFRESVEYAHGKGAKTMVWFEPERVTHLSGMVNYGYKREWVLSDHGNNNCYINNLGNAEALEWTTNRILTFMETHNVDFYREDFNVDPAIFWSIGDGYEGENRIGITENLYMQGHYTLWDSIIQWCGERGKCTWVDSCASGGGRNDLESMRRGVPILRSDSDRTTIPLRLAMSSTLNKWIPFNGAASNETGGSQMVTGVTDIYTLRASYLPSIYYNAKWYHEQDTINWDMLKQGLNEWRDINKYLLKDYYVLTPYRGISNDKDWTAWMYVDTDDNSVVLQAFRPASSTQDTFKVMAKGLDPNSYYTVRDVDGINNIAKVKGSALMKGLNIYAANARTAITLYIEPVA